jgi:hypothetical protein
MFKSLKAVLAALAVSLSTSFAAGGTWATAAVPSSFEVMSRHNNSSPYAEIGTLVFVYMGGVGYHFNLTGDREKAWLELIKTAVTHGKYINFFYDPDYNPPFSYCTDFASNGSCSWVYNTAGPRILKISLQN